MSGGQSRPDVFLPAGLYRRSGERLHRRGRRDALTVAHQSMRSVALWTQQQLPNSKRTRGMPMPARILRHPADLSTGMHR